MPTSQDDLKALTQLGQKSEASRTLEAFPNHAGKNMTVTLHCKEFTCHCPLTKQPDFAEIEIIYQPDQFIVESKSMKLYLESFRDEGVFHEHLAVDIANDFVKFIQPIMITVKVMFNVRGGIGIDAEYTYTKPY